MNSLTRTLAIRPADRGTANNAAAGVGCEHSSQARRLPRTVRFVLHIVETVVAMQLGMAFFHAFLSARLSGNPILHEVVMVLYVTAPMVAVMVWHGHCWRHSVEMGAAMLAGPAILIVCVLLHADAQPPWISVGALPTLASATMYAGMLTVMLYRRAEYA